MSSRDKNHIDETVEYLRKKGIEAFGIPCHVGRAEDRVNLMKKTYEKLGRIDFVVSNAAVVTHAGDF